jgi:hypothetical protein
MNVTPWKNSTIEQRDEWIAECQRSGHDFYYIDGSAPTYRWDCARCNWSELRRSPTLPLNPSMQHPRFQIVDTWQGQDTGGDKGMSTCISRHGEYNDHAVGDDWFCPRCGVFDADGVLAALAYADERMAEMVEREQRVRALSAKWRQTVIDMTEHNKARGLHWYLEGRADDLDAALNGDVS